MRDDVVVTALEDIFTPEERTLIGADRFDTVRAMRLAFEDELEEDFTAVVEEALGRKVRACLSQVYEDPGVAVEVFLLEPEPTESAETVESLAMRLPGTPTTPANRPGSRAERERRR